MLTDPSIQPSAASDQIRPQGGGMLYSPNRDIAYIGVSIVREALVRISQDPINDRTYAVLMEQIPDPEERLKQLSLVAEMLKLCFIWSGNPAPTRLTDLVAKYERFSEINPYALCAVMAQIGELSLACMYQGILDTTPVDGEPANQATIASLIKAAEKLIENAQKE